MINNKYFNVKSGGPVLSGIQYDRPEESGQLVSYALYDNVWHQSNGTYNYTPPTNPISVAKLDNSVTTLTSLSTINFYGDNRRFTDGGGGNGYGDNYVIDHLTGLGWVKSIISPSLNWVDALLYCNSATNNGHTDWRLPTVKEYNSIQNYRRGALHYPPFNYTSNGLLLTSNTYHNSTPNMYYFYPLANSVGNSTKTSTGFRFLMVRNHYN